MTDPAGLKNHFQQARQLYSANDGLTMLLNRLENVQEKKTPRFAKAYLAACPVHESISKSSLSIAQTDDGRVLVHCFGSCATEEILQVCGMQFSDLFPEGRIGHDITPEERLHWKELATHKEWCEARDVIESKTLIVVGAATQLLRGEPLNTPDHRRLHTAWQRLMQEGEKLNG